MNALSVSTAKNITRRDDAMTGKEVPFDIAPVHFEFFETCGIEPLASRVFERDRGARDNPPLPHPQPPVPASHPSSPCSTRRARSSSTRQRSGTGLCQRPRRPSASRLSGPSPAPAPPQAFRRSSAWCPTCRCR